jgi:branched-subunit amino acid aminotransferase/4-amino-4-deoxychorismate lyase
VDITGTITLAEDEVLSNTTDDRVQVTSNDNNMTFAIMGEAAAKSAILELSADAAADDVDTWLFTVADGGALTIANDSTATMTINEVVAFGSGTTQAVVVVTDAAEYDVLAANSGKVHVIKDLAQNTTIDLPAEAAGMDDAVVWSHDGADEFRVERHRGRHRRFVSALRFGRQCDAAR